MNRVLRLLGSESFTSTRQPSLAWLLACVSCIAVGRISSANAYADTTTNAARAVTELLQSKVDAELQLTVRSDLRLVSAAQWNPETDEEVDVEKGLQAVRRAAWYDSETGGYASPKISPEHDNEIRTGGKVADVKPAKAGGESWWDWLTNWNGWGAGFFSTFFSWTMLTIIAAVLIIAVVALLIYSFRDYLPQPRESKLVKRGIDIDLARVEELPFEVRAAALDPLSEAQRLMRSGNFDAAIVYLYGYMLLALDQTRKIHLQKGKTNRMYLRELSRVEKGSLRRIVGSTMLACEQVYFGKHSLSAEHFQLLWEQVDEFNRLVDVAQAAGPEPGSMEMAST